MEKLDKVIRALEECHRDIKYRDCDVCGYASAGSECERCLMEDALDVIGRLREENRDLRKDIEVLTDDLTGAHEEVHKLLKKLSVTRLQRKQAWEKLARIIGEREIEWLEEVRPDWYERLSNLDYEYSPVKDGEPWYRVKDVWACIEEVAE